MAPRLTPKDLDTLTDPHEQDYINAKRGTVPDEHLIEDLVQYRAIQAADRVPDESGGSPAERQANLSDAITPQRPDQPGRSGAPSLEEFLTTAVRENPDYTPEELTRYWEKTYGPTTGLPTLEDFLPKAKQANPDYNETELTQYWRDQYGARGAKEKDPGFFDTLIEGAKGSARSLRAFTYGMMNEREKIEEDAREGAKAPRAQALEEFFTELARRKKEAGPDVSWQDVAKALGEETLKNPKGAALLATEQLPNSAAILGTAGAGALTGSIFGPAGTVVGGLAGLFLGNVGLETGSKLLERASDDRLTPEERDLAMKEGLVKGSVISGVDAATFGATKWVMGTTARAMEAATAKVLTQEGVDITDRTAVTAARNIPDIAEKVTKAQSAAREATTTIAQRAARGGVEVGLESLGEGVGEYLGEAAATGQGDKMEALVEALTGLSQSTAEISIAGAMERSRQAAIEDPGTVGARVASGTSVDDTIKKAQDEVNKPANPDIGVPTAKELDDFIGRKQDEPTGAPPSGGSAPITEPYTESHLHADTFILKDVMQHLDYVKRRPDGELYARTHTGAQVKVQVVRPQDLPDTPQEYQPGKSYKRGNRTYREFESRNLTQSDYEGLRVALQAQGKRLIIFKNTTKSDGFVLSSKYPSIVFMSDRPVYDPAFVAFHEAGHLMQGTPLYTAFQQVLFENMTPEAKRIARQRHGNLPDSRLFNEISADISGDAMTRPEFLQKVMQRMQEQVGEQKAHTIVQQFLDTIKGILTRVLNAVQSHHFTSKHGRAAVERYVRNLEQVHDALASAVADLYLKQGKVQSTETPTPGLLEAKSERMIVHPKVAKVFEDLGRRQRGAPEDAMLDVQAAHGGGVLNPVVEHTGDLIHRMTHMASSGMALPKIIAEKTTRVLNALTHAYGFDKEHALNVKHNAEYFGIAKGDHEIRVNEALKKYADEHEKLPVYNLPQWLAKRASVAVGRKQWDRAVTYLKELKALAESEDFTTLALSAQVNELGEPKEFHRPIRAALIAKTPSGRTLIKGTPEQAYHILDDLDHLLAGTKATEAELKAMGYRPETHDIISHEEDREARKKIEGKETKAEAAEREKKEQAAAEKKKKEQAAKDAKEKARAAIEHQIKETIEESTSTTAFQQWFNGSKVINPDGTPKVVYHGTNREFTEFRKDKQGSTFDYDDLNVPSIGGFYFTDSPNDASAYAFSAAAKNDRGYQQIMPVYLAIKKPYIHTAQDFADEGLAGIPDLSDLKDQGYDGVIIERAHYADYKTARIERDGYQYIAFEPTQIKSATGNKGTFDPNNPHIEESATPEPKEVSPFYSHLIRVLEAKMPNKASAQQIRAILSPNNGVKPDEFEWMGMDQFLDTKDVFTKQEVLAFARENELKLNEIVRFKDDKKIEDLEAEKEAIREKYKPLLSAAFLKKTAAKKAYDEYVKSSPTPVLDRVAKRLMDDPKTANELYNWFVEFPGYDHEEHFKVSVRNTLYEISKGGTPRMIDENEWERIMGSPIVTDQERLELQEEYKKNDREYAARIKSPEHRRLRDAYQQAESEYVTLDEKEHEEIEALRDRMSLIRPKFDDVNLNLPGGKNYKEMLFQLPFKQSDLDAPYLDQSGGMYGWYAKGQLVSPLFANERDARLHAPPNYREIPDDFNQGHWDEANVLAHTRFDSRTIDGQPATFLQEIQSDWHQKGRKYGYKTLNAAERKELADLQLRWQEQGGYEGRLTDFNHEEIGRLTELNERMDASGVPNAPFKKSWPDLVFRRMVRYAADQGSKFLAWTTGDQQAERYDLSKQIKEIEYERRPKEESGGEEQYRLSVTTKDGRDASPNGWMNLSEIENFVGKEIAEKISKGEGKKYRGHDGLTLEGLDLKIGGEGMKGFYDKILVDLANKIGKRFNVEVERKEMPTADIEGRRLHASQIRDGKWALFENHTGLRFGTFSYKTEAEANEAIRNKTAGLVTVHALPITDAMKKSVQEEGQPLFSVTPEPEEITNSAPYSYSVTQPGMLDYLIRKLQDRNIDVKRILQAMAHAGLPIPDSLNAVFKEEMYNKRAEIRSEDFKNKELKPLLKKMEKWGLSVDEVDRYLFAEHVVKDDLNTKLAALNPNMPNNTALAGSYKDDQGNLVPMTDQEAHRILQSYTGDRELRMKEISADVRSMINETRRLLVDYGLENQQTIANWNTAYRSYVPLRRDAFDEVGHPTGTGRSVRGSTSKERLGSELEVGSILANVAQARDQTITRGEKMRPVVAMAGLMMLHPNSEIGHLDKYATITITDPVTGLPVAVPVGLGDYKVPTVRRKNPFTGQVSFYPDPLYKGRDNVVNFRVNGEDYAIVFNEKNERALEAAKAFRELDSAKLNGVMAAVAPFTRYLAAINTQYNPIFGVVNFVRDAQFASLALSSTPLAGKQAQILKNAILSMKGIFQDARDARFGIAPSSPTAQLWERFQHMGGPTGYRDMFMSTRDRKHEIERLLHPTTWKNVRSPQDLARRLEDSAFFHLLSDYNTTMENAIRLAVFKTGVESGLSDLEAASHAKNITVNFNKRGQIGAQMGSLYAFFNANVQGTARILETLFERDPLGGVRISPAGKKIVTGGMLLGVLQTFLLGLGGFEGDEPPEYVKNRNFVVPAPGTEKGYAMVPLPLGFNLLPNIGRLASEIVRNGIEGKPLDVMKKGFDLFYATLSTLSPTGGSGGIVLETMPTVLDPLASLSVNRDWTGKSISKEDISSQKPTPGHTRAHDTATPWAMTISKFINWATGGTDYTPGMLSPTPDAVDFLIGQVTGGIGREVSKFGQVVKSADTGEELPIYKYPLLGRFAGSSSGSAGIRNRFYENVKAANLAYGEVEGRAKNHEEFQSFLQTHPEARFKSAAEQTQRAIGTLQDAKRRLVDQNGSKEQVKLYEEQITATMKRFNDRMDEARKLR